MGYLVAFIAGGVFVFVAGVWLDGKEQAAYMNDYQDRNI